MIVAFNEDQICTKSSVCYSRTIWERKSTHAKTQRRLNCEIASFPWPPLMLCGLSKSQIKKQTNKGMGTILDDNRSLRRGEKRMWTFFRSMFYSKRILIFPNFLEMQVNKQTNDQFIELVSYLVNPRAIARKVFDFYWPIRKLLECYDLEHNESCYVSWRTWLLVASWSIVTSNQCYQMRLKA